MISLANLGMYCSAFTWKISDYSRTLCLLPHLAKNALELGVLPLAPGGVQSTITLININLALSDIVRALESPQGPVGVVVLHVTDQAGEVGIVFVAEALVGTTRHTSAEFAQEKGAPLLIALLQDKAEEEAVLGLLDVAVAEIGRVDGEDVRVGLPHVLVGPVAGGHLAVAEGTEVIAAVEAADDDEGVGVDLVDDARGLGHLVEPGLAAPGDLGDVGAELVAQGHADDAGAADGPLGHVADALEPQVRVEELAVGGDVPGGVLPPAVAVVEVAAPVRLADVVVEDGHDALLPESGLDGAEGADDGGVGQEGVLLGGLLVQLHDGGLVDAGAAGAVAEALLDAGVGALGHVDGVGQADAVEALVGDPVGDVVDGLAVQALGDVGLHVAGPVDAAELDAGAVGVDDPAGRGGQGHGGLLGRDGGQESQGSRAEEVGEELHGCCLYSFPPSYTAVYDVYTYIYTRPARAPE